MSVVKVRMTRQKKFEEDEEEEEKGNSKEKD